MPTSAPYWGQLPGPQGKPRRQSDDYIQADRGQPSHNRAKRDSAQTTSTDAPTESTLSPYASPTRSSFQGGLAPPPQPLPYGETQYANTDLAEKRRRRAARNQEEEPFVPAGPPPPAAPEVPKAPPVSYKHPYGNGALPYTYTGNGPPRARGGVAMEPDQFYKDQTPPAERNYEPVLDRARRTLDDNAAPRSHRVGGNRADLSRGGSTRLPPDGNEPLGPVTEAQRKMWAQDRSPLQRLELTLDSITKEEKRARAEAAEARARERAAGVQQQKQQPLSKNRGQDSGQPDKGVRFRDRRAPAGGEGAGSSPRARVGTDPIQSGAAAGAHESPLSRHPPEDGTKSGTTAVNTKSRSQKPVAKGRDSEAQNDGIPKRNLSFRDRAVNDDVTPPHPVGSGSSQASPVTTPGSGLSLTRNGSNKLKKNPPGDPWYSARRQVEEKYPEVVARGAAANRRSPPTQGVPAGDDYDYEYEDYEHSPSRNRGAANNDLPARSDSFHDPLRRQASMNKAAKVLGPGAIAGMTAANMKRSPSSSQKQKPGNDYQEEDDLSDASSHSEGFYDFRHRHDLKPGQGIYQPPTYLDEWKQGTVGTLSGALLDLGVEPPSDMGQDQAWWEQNHQSRRRGSVSARPQKAEAFDGEYDDTVATRFKPALYLKCGPLLRYCGIRHEKAPARTSRGAVTDREIWRGSVMIVTQDDESSYDIAPTLRLFVQPIELLPPPPAEIRGQLSPEYVDPIAGIPKLGRKGETLYVRPVEHLEEAKDLSNLKPGNGLFETTRSAPDFDSSAPDPPGSFASRRKRIQVDGEKLNKYKDVRGFRLHAERGYTFWRFNIEVELREKQQRIAYRINRGPSTGFWVPARGESMNIMFHSCNGFSLSVQPDELSGPDPMWRDVLNTHQTQPFHVMLGGGDQIYNDAVMRQTRYFKDWLDIRNPLHKQNAPFTAKMQNELEHFYLERYSTWFSQGLFGLANSQIPMVNMYDDHDIIDGFGSYPHHFMQSPVFSGLGNVAFKYYMLFQHQSIPDEGEAAEPSWTLGLQPGPYIQELSRSLFMHLGSKLALLAVDARTERQRDEIISEETWKKIMDRCYEEIVKNKTQHLLVLLGVPIAYPRLVWLENILTSRLMDPVKALGKMGLLGNTLNRFDGGVEVLDDLDDHWTAKNHKQERALVIEDLQDLAADKSIRVTILSGDVHLAAVGQFYSNQKVHPGLAKHKDFRYMPNVISSAIVNTPPPDMMADVLNKRNKVHHFDKDTEEDMIPIFETGVDGKPRNNKRLLPHRNWCSIREYVPGSTPPPTPPPEPEEYDAEHTPEGTPPGARVGLLRRLSSGRGRNRGPAYRPDVPKDQVDKSRPPLSGGFTGLMRSLSKSRRNSSEEVGRSSGPGKLMRTLSLGRGDYGDRKDSGDRSREQHDYDDYQSRSRSRSHSRSRSRNRRRSRSYSRSPSPRPRKRGFSFGGLFKRSSSKQRADDGGINGDWGTESEVEYDDDYDAGLPPRRGQAVPESSPRTYAPANAPDYSHGSRRGGNHGQLGLRGGGRHDEYESGDDSYFTMQAPRKTSVQPTARDRRRDDFASANTDQVSKPTTTEPTTEFRPKPVYRTPTGLSMKQAKRMLKDPEQHDYNVNLDGGLNICLNVEVNPKDPAGITVPYRLLVPRLWYEHRAEDAVVNEDVAVDSDGAQEEFSPERPPQAYVPEEKQMSGLKRWFSGRGKKDYVAERMGSDEEYYDDDRRYRRHDDDDYDEFATAGRV